MASSSAVASASDGPAAASLRVLPPSPNWYCSQICDWGWTADGDALVAFGAKNDVYVYQVRAPDAADVSALGGSAGLAFHAQIPRGRKAQRVTALRFLPGSGTVGPAAVRPRVVCGSEGGHVQIWDVEAREVVEQHRKHAAEITAVATAASGARNSSLLVAGDRQGCVSCWMRDTGRVSTLAPVSGDGVFSMAMSPRDASLVAVGFRSGKLCLIDALLGAVLHREDAHDQELQSLSWSPIHAPGAWLASSSRDKSIKVWRVSTGDSDGQKDSAASNTAPPPAAAAATLALSRVLRLPTGKQGQAYNPSKHLWLPVAWSSVFVGGHDAAEPPTETLRLWSGSFDGNLLLWDVPVVSASTGTASGSAFVKPVAVKNGHNRILFNIVALPADTRAQVATGLPWLLTVSLDRELRLWTETPRAKPKAKPVNAGASAGPPPAAARTVSKLLGLGGHVYCAAYSARASTLALACGDQTIRLWKLGGRKAGSRLPYDTELLWKGLKSKVTSVAWHPLAAGVLAFGTEDGAVGVYDTQAKKQTRLRASHVGEVQQVGWRLEEARASAAGARGGADAFMDAMQELERAQAAGASLDDALSEQEASKPRAQAELRVLLWSCDASGQLLESDVDRPEASSTVVGASQSCSAFALSEDEDGPGVAAVGRSNGSVRLVDPSAMGRAAHSGAAADAALEGRTLHDHSERVGAMAWGARGDVRLLATGSDDGKISVYRFDSDAPTLVAQLAGHSGKVTCLRWQPPALGDGDSGEHPASAEALPLLASCAADGSARVWDVLDRERQPLARFTGHVGRVLALDWVSHSVVVTGGEDQTARVWDLRSFPADADDGGGASAAAPSIVASPRGAKPASSKPPRSSPIGSGATPAKKTNGAVSVSLGAPSGAAKQKAKAKRAALFHAQKAPTPSEEVARRFAQRLNPPLHDADAASREDSDAFMTALLQLGDGPEPATPRRAMAAFATAEQTRFASQGDWEGQARVLLLGGQVADALRVVAAQGALDATWLALAPMAGLDVWREMAELFARQLEAQSEHAQAAIHWLSLGKVRMAARALEAGSAFREALALLRLRLGPSDPLVVETAGRYAEWLEARGHLGDAALVYLGMEHMRSAAPAGDTLEAPAWRWRAVRALVKTCSAACVAQAVELLHEAARGVRVPLEALEIPASFLTVEVIGLLVREGQLSVAERAADLLLLPSPSIRVHSSLPMAPTCFRLTRCLLGVLRAMERHSLAAAAALPAAGTERKTLRDWQREWPTSEAVQLLLALQSTGDRAYPLGLFSASLEALVTRTDAFWSDALHVCRRSGVWSAEDGAEADGSTLEEAQELLMDGQASWLLRECVAVDPAADLRVGAAIDLLRLLVDALAGCLVSAMEHLERLLDAAAACPTDAQADVVSLAAAHVTLALPSGVASAPPSSLLAVGELAEELADAQSLWRMSRLHQCRALVVQCARRSVAGDAREWVVDTSRAVLDGDAANDDLQSDYDDAGACREVLEQELAALESEPLALAV